MPSCFLSFMSVDPRCSATGAPLAPPARKVYKIQQGNPRHRPQAEFYGLPGLTAAIDRYPWSVVRATRAACVEDDAHWVRQQGASIIRCACVSRHQPVARCAARCTCKQLQPFAATVPQAFSCMHYTHCGLWQVYEDGADEIVLQVDAPCQLMGVGLCGSHGG